MFPFQSVGCASLSSILDIKAASRTFSDRCRSGQWWWCDSCYTCGKVLNSTHLIDPPSHMRDRMHARNPSPVFPFLMLFTWNVTVNCFIVIFLSVSESKLCYLPLFKWPKHVKQRRGKEAISNTFWIGLNWIVNRQRSMVLNCKAFCFGVYGMTETMCVLKILLVPCNDYYCAHVTLFITL